MRWISFLFGLGVLALYCALPASVQAQAVPDSVRVYQLSGLVVNKQTGEPVPFTRVRINSSRRRTTANEEGFYSIPVILADTLYFSSLGYRPSKLIVQDYIKEYQGDKATPYIYEIHYLAEDSVQLPDVVIHRYSNFSPEEFRTAMLNMPLPQDAPAAIARDNVDPQLIAYFMKTLPVDEQERVAASQQRYYQLYRQQNTYQTAPFFNAMAVYQLMNYFTQRSRQKKEKTYNYWPDK